MLTDSRHSCPSFYAVASCVVTWPLECIATIACVRTAFTTTQYIQAVRLALYLAQTTLNPWLEVEVNTCTTFVAYVRTCLLHFKLWVSPQVLVTELIEKAYGRFVGHVH